MKKSKLLLSMLSLCFALIVLCFGVYAANQVNYSISGNISYTVEDAFVEVRTKIYSLDELSDGPTLTNTCFELGQKDFFNSSNFSSYDLVDINIPMYQSINDTQGSGGLYDELDLTFDDDAKTFYVVMNVKNLSSDINVWAVMDYSASKYVIPEGVIQRDNAIQQWIGTKEGTRDNQSIVIGLSVSDPTTSFEDEDIKLSIKIGAGDYSQTAENLNKMTFDESSYNSANGEYMLTGFDEDAGGVIVIPEYYYDEEDEENHAINFLADNEDLDGSDFGEIKAIAINASLSKIGKGTFFNFYYMVSLVFNNAIDNLQEDLLDSGTFTLEYICVKYVPNARYTTHTSDGSINLNAIIDTTNKVLLMGSAGTDFEHLPNDLIKIGNSAFNSNKSLTGVIISDSIRTIGSYVFSTCHNIKFISIPASVVTMDEGAFSDWTDEQTVHVYWTGGVKPAGWDENWNTSEANVVIHSI